MKKISWLQLSDWHQGHSGRFDRKILRDALLEDVQSRTAIDGDLENIDFVVFCGDLAHAGQESEFREAGEQFLNPIMEKLGLVNDNAGERRIFMVPGNHDLDRNIIGEWLPSGLLPPASDPTVVQKWLGSQKRVSRAMEPFDAYREFVSGFSGQPDPEYASVNRLNIRDVSVAILCLNSAWMCARNKNHLGEYDDYGYAVVGEPQVYDAIRKISDAKLKIVVMHHPFSWLIEFDKDQVKSRILKGADFLLVGHTHKPDVEVLHSTQGDCIIIPSGSNFDGRYTLNNQYTNSYNFVTVDLDLGVGRVYFRRWSESQKRWIADSETYPGGVYSFQLPVVSAIEGNASEAVLVGAGGDDTSQGLSPSNSGSADVAARVQQLSLNSSSAISVPIDIGPIVFPATDSGRIGLKKFKALIEEGREVELLEGEFEWIPKNLKDLPEGVDCSKGRMVLKPNLPSKQVPVCAEAVNPEGVVVARIDSAFLGITRFGSMESEFVMNGGQLGGEFCITLRKSEELNSTFTYSFSLMNVPAGDALSTVVFAMSLVGDNSIIIRGKDAKERLMSFGGFKGIDIQPSMESARAFLGWLMVINEKLGLDLRYPEEAPTQSDWETAELLSLILSGKAASKLRPKTESLLLQGGKELIEKLIADLENNPSVVMNSELAKPFELLGSSISVPNVKMHFADVVAKEPLERLAEQARLCAEDELISVELDYSKVIFRIENDLELATDVPTR